MLLLAKNPQLTEYLVWVGASIAVVVLATLCILAYRRRILGPSQSEIQTGLLDELREMRNRGDITEEEFNATKRAMAARAAGKPLPPPEPKPGELRAAPGFDLTGQPLPSPEKRPPNPPNV